MAINTQKLLPSAKGSPLAKIKAAKVVPNFSIIKKKIDIQKLIGPSKEDDSKSIQKTLVNIDSSLKLILKEDQQEQGKKRKEKEKADFEKEERKLEAPKEAKKFNFPTLSLPGSSFLDRIKRFLFFTALGWLFTRFQDQLPKLEGIVKTITQVYGIAEGIFKSLLSGLVNFIDIGYQTYDGLRKKVEDLGGKDAVKTFDKFSSELNQLLNKTLIVATLVASTSSKQSSAPSGAGAAAGVPKPTTPPKPISGFGGGTEMTPGRYRAPGQSASRGFALEQARKGLTFEQSVAARQASKVAPAAKGAKFGLGRAPIVGPLITFGIRTLVYGEKPQKAAAAAVGMGIGQAIGTFIGTIGATALGLGTGGLGAFVAPLIIGAGSVIGGLVGEWLGAKLYDFVAGLGNKNKPQLKAAGGSVTRGGKRQGGPSRTLKITRKRPPKVKPKQSQPGKDVGGKKNIQKLYPDPSARTEIEGQQKSPWFDLLPTDQAQRDSKLKSLPNPYKALTGVAKKLKDIPFGIGALMGGAVDIALGEKLPKNAGDSLSSGISYLISAIANQQISSSLSGIEKEISKMQSGGQVPKLRGFTKNDDLDLTKGINKILGGLIQNKVDEAIREVQKQLMPAKYSEQRVSPPGERGPSAPPSKGPGGGGGGGPSPTGENGRLSESVLKSVGPGGCRGGCRLWKPAAEAYLKMKEAAAKDKINFYLESAYRSYEHQKELYDAYKRGTGNLAAAPGTSDHGLGKAIDLYPTAAQDWVRAKGRQYGWYWPPETGEPWHFVYVGGGRLEPQKPQTQLPGQQPQIPDAQNYGVKDGEQKRVKYNNKNYVIARDKGKWRVYKVNPTTGLLEEVDRTDQSFVKVLDEYRKTQSPTSPKPQQPPGPSGSVKQSGVASWYGPGFDGKKTANGEIFDTNKLTAAHPTLPFGTMVTVTNKANGKSVRVKINDRGPFAVDSSGNAIYPLRPHPTRVIDLSKAARDALGGQDLTQVDLSYKGGGLVPKQSPKNKTSSLTKYPSYSDGEMMIAIQPIIIEKVTPVSMGRGGGILAFPGVNNTMMSNLSNLGQG